MKTPREIVEGWHNGYELTDDSWIEMKANAMIEAVTAIQQDAFESGRVAGWKEAMKSCDCSVLVKAFGEHQPTSTEK